MTETRLHWFFFVESKQGEKNAPASSSPWCNLLQAACHDPARHHFSLIRIPWNFLPNLYWGAWYVGTVLGPKWRPVRILANAWLRLMAALFLLGKFADMTPNVQTLAFTWIAIFKTARTNRCAYLFASTETVLTLNQISTLRSWLCYPFCLQVLALSTAVSYAAFAIVTKQLRKPECWYNKC